MSELLRTSAQRMAGRLSAGLSWLGDRAGSSPGILMYHRVAERTAGVPEPSINVTPRQFHRQLAGLQARGYEFWPLTRLLDSQLQTNAVAEGKKIVVLTFDDGYESVYSAAFPILSELNIPATIFLNTAFLDSEEPFPFDRWGVAQRSSAPPSDWRPLSRAQCKEMQVSGLIELGAHTHTHADFRNRAAEFKLDLAHCLQVLRDDFQINRPSFAFPFGRWHLGYVSNELLQAACECGVSCALTTECELIKPGSDPLGWGRFNVYDWDTPSTLAARLRGWYGWAPRWQNRLRGLRLREGATP